MRTIEPPFAALHAELMARACAPSGIGDAHDDFTCALISYQVGANSSLHLDRVARMCDLRAGRPDLPLDLVAAYTSLSQLARWRIAQLQQGPLVQR